MTANTGAGSAGPSRVTAQYETLRRAALGQAEPAWSGLEHRGGTTRAKATDDVKIPAVILSRRCSATQKRSRACQGLSSATGLTRSYEPFPGHSALETAPTASVPALVCSSCDFVPGQGQRGEDAGRLGCGHDLLLPRGDRFAT
jgi:hypothetical protein